MEATRLRQLFRRTEFLRSVNRYGFVSVQRFYLSAENGLARQRVSIWIYEDELRITSHQTFLAQYRCLYDPKHKQLQAVSAPTLYTTPFASPQLELIELDDTQWRKWLPRPARAYTKHRAMFPQQLSLLACKAFALILWAFKAV